MAGFGDSPFGDSPFGVGDGGQLPLTVTAQPDATPPRIRLDITTPAASVNIFRVAQDGTKTPVRTYDGGPLSISGGSTFLYDPEVPFGKPVYFITDNGLRSETVTIDVPDVWLIHPLVPARSVKVKIVSVSERTAAASQSVRYPLGRTYPIVASDGVRKAAAYSLVLYTADTAEAAALDKVLADLSPLLLNVPPSKGWVDPGTEYIAAGDLTRSNPGTSGFVTARHWSLPCSVVDRPAGGSQAFNTYGYSYSLYPTYAQRKAAAATYGDAFDAA